MELQKIVVLCIALALAGGGVWYIAGQSDDGANQTGLNSAEEVNQVETTNGVNESFSGFGSFTSLLGLGQNITCDYSFSDAEGNSGSGTGYFTGERMRVDSVMTSDGETFDSSIINDGTHIYTWTTSGEEEFAMKMTVPDEDTSATDYTDTTNKSEQGMVDANQEVEYDCNRWRVDASVFVPPSDVEFMDMSAMMNEMMQGLPEGFTMPEGFPTPQ